MKIEVKLLNIDIIDLVLVLFCLFTLFFPASLSPVRGAFLLLWAILSVIENRGKLIGPGINVFFIYLGLNVISLCVGLINNTPGAIRCMTIDFLWPLLFLCGIQSIDTDKRLRLINKSIVYIYEMICIFDVIYILLSVLGIWNSSPLSVFNEVLDCNFGSYDGFLKYTTTHMVTHIYMGPFVITLISNNQDLVPKRRLTFVIILSLLCVIISGRVALILAYLICSLFGLFFFKKGKNSKRGVNLKAFFTTIIVLIIIAFAVSQAIKMLNIDLNVVLQNIQYKFISSQDTSTTNGIRIIQRKALLNGWEQSPIIGNGTGAYIPNVIRDQEQPWNYEYSYYAILFQKGILGLFGCFLLYGWILISLVRIYRYKILPPYMIIPHLIGFVAILIANYADPYLGKMGCMWMIYFPFAIANNWLPYSVVKQEVKETI